MRVIVMPNTYRWSEDRLRKLEKHYQQLLRRASAADSEERKRLILIMRRARKRLARLGITVRERPHGEAQCFQRRLLQPPVKDDDLLLTNRIVSYIKRSNLFYGTSVEDRPSWAIALNTYHIPRSVADHLRLAVPELISEYAIVCDDLIKRALSDSANPIVDILLYGIPTAVQQLWLEFVARRPKSPFCFRPDLILETSGKARVIEFNIDSRLDRGIAYGVSDYSTELLESRGLCFLANDLPGAYARAAKALTGSAKPRVATLYNPECRAEYAKQEDFFCRAISKAEDFSWRMLPISQTVFDTSSGFLIERDTGDNLDAVLLELELLAYDNPRLDECNFVENLLYRCPNTHILGSILPFADKLLLALTRISSVVSQQLLSTFVPTWIPGKEAQFRAPASLDELRGCHSHQHHFVLKRAGIDLGTTGSEQVIISSDVPHDVWINAIEQALRDLQTGRHGWVVQPRVEPEPYRVRYKLTPRGKTREDNCFVRLSGFYAFDGYKSDHTQVPRPNFSLAGAVATAGTDQQTLRRRLYAIRGLRQSTYMAVSTTHE